MKNLKESILWATITTIGAFVLFHYSKSFWVTVTGSVLVGMFVTIITYILKTKFARNETSKAPWKG